MNPVLLESLASLEKPIPKPPVLEKSQKNPKIVLVFDTETSGLFPKNPENVKIEDYPFILQLSFVLYDMESKKVVYKYNKYIKVPEHVVISPFITNLTGITHEICNTGVNIVSALHELYRAYKLCDAIVGHNISFDFQMVEIEIIRNNRILLKTNPMIAFMCHSIVQKLENKQIYCTMSLGRNICNLMVASKTNPQNFYKKNPKLEELYEYLFMEKIPNAHDAMVDTMACLRCFVKIRLDLDIGRDF